MFSNSKNDSRKKRHRAIRKRIEGSTERPRLAVFRSTRHIYAQVIDDLSRKTLVSTSDVETRVFCARSSMTWA
jgi:large subunit ribosomal protein L18